MSRPCTFVAEPRIGLFLYGHFKKNESACFEGGVGAYIVPPPIFGSHFGLPHRHDMQPKEMTSKEITQALRNALKSRLTGQSETDCRLTPEDVQALADKIGLKPVQIKRYAQNFRFRTPMADRQKSLESVEDPEEVRPPTIRVEYDPPTHPWQRVNLGGTCNQDSSCGGI